MHFCRKYHQISVTTRDLSSSFLASRARQQSRMSGFVRERLQDLELISRLTIDMFTPALRSFIQTVGSTVEVSCANCNKPLTSKGIMYSKPRAFCCAICTKTFCDTCCTSNVPIAINPNQSTPFPCVTACLSCARHLAILSRRTAPWLICQPSSKALFDFHSSATVLITSIQQKLANWEGICKLVQMTQDLAVDQLGKDMMASILTDLDRLKLLHAKIQALKCPSPPHRDSVVQDMLQCYVHDIGASMKMRIVQL